MKKEHQIGIRVGLPAFFALELEDVYKHNQGAHRALTFPDFVGLLVGMGLEQYRKENTTASVAGEHEAPEDIEEQPEGEPLHLFDIDSKNLHSLFKEFEEAMEPNEEKPGFKFIGPEDWE